MKGLMYNLLDAMARDAGCSDEAWELIVEFASAERALSADPSEMCGIDAYSDVHPPHLFEAPTEAMLSCLSQDPQFARPSQDFFDMEALGEWLGADDLEDLLPSCYDAKPSQPVPPELRSGWDEYDDDGVNEAEDLREHGSRHRLPRKDH